MNFLSVCSGIEAASVAWTPLGWRATAFSEIEPFPCALLAHHYPNVPNLGDMTKFKDWPDAAIDLLCGGTPCQSYSISGLRAGLADPRGDLMLTFGAVAAKYRPRWLVWENVPGVLSSNGGRDFGTFLGLLGFLGYGFAYRVLDAQYFGLAQRRKRVFVVACLGDWRSAAAVLFERHSMSGHPAPSRETREEVAGTIAGGARQRGGYSTDDVPLYQAFGGNRTSGSIDVTPALLAQPGSGWKADFESETFLVDTVHTLRGEGFDASEDGTGRGTPLIPVAVDIRNSALAEDGPTQTLQAAGLGTERGGNPNAVPHVLAFHGSQDPDVSGDVTHPVGRNQGQETCALQGMRVRRLTPEECEALQGFRRGYTNIPLRNSKGRPSGKWAKDGPRYKALGNTWAIPPVRWIGQRIMAVNAIQIGRRAA